MNRNTACCIIILLLLSSDSLYSWGFYAHKRINKYATFILPSEMFLFYKKYILQIELRSVNPDKRRHLFEDEPPRHYIDLDHYEHQLPIDTVPKKWKDAVAKYSVDTLMSYGILPWHLQLTMHSLTKAFENLETENIIRLSSDLGHYVADAHVPLHTTQNYNGQLTNQKGIHGFWESRLPELFLDNEANIVCCLEYLSSVEETVWEIIENAHKEVSNVLDEERKLDASYSKDKKYAIELKNNKSIKQYSRAYSKAYYNRVGGVMERQYQSAIIRVASFWYTAWVNAGMPNLSKIEYYKQKIIKPSVTNTENHHFMRKED